MLLHLSDRAAFGVGDLTGELVLDVARSRGSVASLAAFGRFAACFAFHCATPARYTRIPFRVAALRRSSREIVDGSRPICRAISRTPWFCAFSKAISSRSAYERYLPVGTYRHIGDIPPAWRNHRVPTGVDTPTLAAASSVVTPSAINRQKARCTARDGSGRPR